MIKHYYMIGLFGMLLSSTIAFCKTDPDEYSDPLLKKEGVLEPWFTGPLLASAAHTIPEGHFNLEPYIFVTDNIGIFDHHWKRQSTNKSMSINPLVLITVGLTSWMDCQVTPQFIYNKQHSEHDFRIGDLNAQVGFQALTDKQGSFLPDLRITLAEIFPAGHYQHLDPDKNGMDSTGLGSYQTKISFNFQKLFIIGTKLFRPRFIAYWIIPSSVSVEGFNSFGGGYGAFGKIHLGQSFGCIFSGEYTLTQHWVAAFDLSFTTNNGSSFKGFPGITKEGGLSHVEQPPSSQLSLAPAIEYNFNSKFGLIGGIWFTLAGRNSTNFVSGVIALNYYH